MKHEKLVCGLAAMFIGACLTASATGAAAGSPTREVVVEGKRIDPAFQREISLSDLNLAFKADQRVLKGRIRKTANGLCYELNAPFGVDECTKDAVHSTDSQVASAIARAERRMAGLPAGPAVAISIVVGGRR